jgi:hypothetical protein
MKKIILQTTAILLLATGGFSSCGKEKESMEISSCQGTNLDSDSILMLENLQTKLYFLTTYPGIAPQVLLNPSDGISCRKGVNSAILNLTNYKGRSLHCPVCNFPDFVLSWNPQNGTDRIGSSMIEGKLDVIINGKVYISFEDENTILGTLELIAIKK